MMVFDRVTYRYNDKTETSFVMKEVSFSLEKNVVNGVIGPNGSGKSTLLKLMSGILTPVEGRIVIDDDEANINCLTDRIRVGIIFQNPDNQIVGTTVEEDLAFGLENLGIEQQLMEERVNEIAHEFQLTSLLKMPVNNLSGGQKQLLCIASVMVMKPDWVVFDEPTSHLDPWARNDFWKTIRTMAGGDGPGIIIVSQLLEDICRFDHALVLHCGQLAFSGAAAELKTQESLPPGVLLPPEWIMQRLLDKSYA